MFVASVYDDEWLYHVENCEKIKDYSQESLILGEFEWQLQELGFKACACTIENDDFLENAIKKLIACCEKYNLGYKVSEERFFIQTKYSEWYFDITKGSIHLMHKNSRKARKDDFHKQFVKKIGFEEIVNYIVKHDKKLYNTDKLSVN